MERMESRRRAADGRHLRAAPKGRHTIKARFTLLAAALAACGPEARVTAEFLASPPIDVRMLTLDLDDGAHQWRWTADDFTTEDGHIPRTPAIRTARKGILRVSVRVENIGAPVTQGTVELPLQSDWEWTIQLLTATEDPLRQCFGCSGARALPLPPALRPPGQDSLWIVWGGNSIENPVVY